MLLKMQNLHEKLINRVTIFSVGIAPISEKIAAIVLSGQALVN